MRIVDAIATVLAMVRDVLLIIVLAALIATGVTVLRGLADAAEQIEQLQPATAPLPVDPCGGGKC
jgi:hypothetical protein